MAKSRKHKKNKSSSNIFDFNPRLNVPRKFQVISNIILEAQKLNYIELDKFLNKIFKSPLCPYEINCVYPSDDLLFSNFVYTFKGINEDLTWFKNLFIRNCTLVNNFLEKKKDFDISVLTGNISFAQEIISNINKEVCHSLWAIEMNTHIKKEFLFEDTSEYLTKIKDSLNNNVSDFYFQQLILKSESKEVETFKISLVEVLEEMRNTQNDPFINNFADLASSYFLPYEYDMNRCVNSRRFRNATAYSLIDQYLIFKTYITEKVLFGDQLTKIEKTITEEILNYIKDDELENLFLEQMTIEKLCQKNLDIIKSYTLEDYSSSQKLIYESIEKDASFTTLIEIYSKCTYEDINENELGLFKRLSQEYKNILVPNELTISSINEIEKIATKFRFSNWSIPILYHTYRIINEKALIKDIPRKKLATLGNKLTPYCLETFNYSNLLNILHIKEENLSKQKKLKLFDTSLFNEDELNSYLIDIQRNSKFLSDYYIEKSRVLLEHNKISECLKFISTTYLKNNIYHVILPIREILDIVEKRNLELTSIELLIVFDMYSRQIDSLKDEYFIEIFQDYIESFDTYKPSEIFKDKSLLSNEEKYFLKNICIPEIIDVFPEYGCTENLKRERINILDILIDHDSKNMDFYKKEKTRIFDELIFDKLKSDFNSSKIYVDIETLKNKRESEYKRLFELLENAKLLSKEENINNDYVQLDKEEDVWIPTTDITTITSKIYSTIFNDFVSNPDFGLDKYLSADIRHGVFVPHMRSSIENLHLLTESKNGFYQDNIYWLEKYPYVVDSIKADINNALKIFSEEIDDALNETNNWFKINIYVEDIETINPEEGLFDFTKSKERLDLLKDAIFNISNFDTFLSTTLDFMWNITEHSTNIVKNKLNTQLKPRLLNAIDKLEDSINDSRISIPLKELLDSIQLSRNAIHEDLERVHNWFNCVDENNNSEQYKLSSTLQACKVTFKNIAQDTEIELNFLDDTYNQKASLTYRETRALMSSLFTALINSNTYKKKDKPIIMNISQQNLYYLIIVKNSFQLPKDLDKEKFLTSLREKFSDKYYVLSTSEGGTGLYKIYNFLSTVSNKFTFDIDIDDENNFIVKIGIKL